MASGLGRFMSADPGNAGADFTNPQSWNGYGYVLGNPLGLVDPSGMTDIMPGEPGDPGDPFDPCRYEFICYGPTYGYGGGDGGGTGGGGAGGGNTPTQASGGGTPLPPNSFPGGRRWGCRRE